MCHLASSLLLSLRLDHVLLRPETLPTSFPHGLFMIVAKSVPKPYCMVWIPRLACAGRFAFVAFAACQGWSGRASSSKGYLQVLAALCLLARLGPKTLNWPPALFEANTRPGWSRRDEGLRYTPPPRPCLLLPQKRTPISLRYLYSDIIRTCSGERVARVM